MIFNTFNQADESHSLSPITDYSCVHSNSWIVNTAGSINSNINGNPRIDITSSAYDGSGNWRITFTGITDYPKKITTKDIQQLNSHSSSDFTNGLPNIGKALIRSLFAPTTLIHLKMHIFVYIFVFFCVL